MQKKETAIEVKVGLVVLLALIALGAFIVVIGDFKFGGGGQTLYVDYQSAAGLKPGAPFRLSGIDAGSIRRVEYMGGEIDDELGRPVFVRATIDVDEEYMAELGENTEFKITTQGVLGEPYVEAFTPEDPGAPLDSGDIVLGDDPAVLADMLNSAGDALDGINELVARLNEQGAGTDIRIDDFINNIGDLAGSLNERIEENADEIDAIFEDVAQILDENKDKLPRILDNVEGAAGEFEQVGASLSYSLGSGQTLRTTLTNIEEITTEVNEDIDPVMNNVRDLTGNANDLIVENRESIDNTIASLESATGNVDVVVQRVASGEGTVGRLLIDEEIFEDVREFIRELKRRPWRMLWKE